MRARAARISSSAIGHRTAQSASWRPPPNSTNVPTPERARPSRRCGCAAARSSTARPSDLKSVISVGATCARRPCRRSTSPSSPRMCVVVDGALALRDQEVARPRSAPTRGRSTKSRERATAAVSSSRGGGHARADGVDVRAGREPLAEEHRLARRGRRADDVGARRRPPRPWRTASTGTPWRAGLALGEGAARSRRLARDAHAAQRPHGEHRLEVRARLDAGAEDREVAGVLARQQRAWRRPLTAAVRIAVIDVASMIASSRPRSASKSRTAPWCESSSVPWFPGKNVMTLSPSASEPGQVRRHQAERPGRSGSHTIGRSGMRGLAARERRRSARAITSMHSAMGRSRGTSAWLTIRVRARHLRRLRRNGMDGRISRGLPATASGRSSARARS